MVAEDDAWARLDAALPGEELAAATAAAAASLRRVSKKDLARQWTGWASRLTSLSQEPRVLLSAAGPALLSCAFALLQRADSVAVVDPVLKEECHRIETWCAQFVRNLAGGPSREEVDQLLSDVRADAPRSCQALLRHEVHTLVCTLQALRSTRGDRPRGGAPEAAERDAEVVARVDPNPNPNPIPNLNLNSNPSPSPSPSPSPTPNQARCRCHVRRREQGRRRREPRWAARSLGRPTSKPYP